jgi:SAM-dependent methyltransferase
MHFTDPVEEQYTGHSYPEPGNDIPTWLKSWNYNSYDPDRNEALFWPEGRPRLDLEVLVAGCGTMQAAVRAFNNPKCKITGIDFSQTSIAHEERLRERHNLENLTLRKMDLRDAAKLGSSFDLIVSSGVLHHLIDPNEGLQALASALEPSHGVMLIMVYGRMARVGVYALQDAFRRMWVPQTVEGVKFVRETIQRLRARHPGRWYFDMSPEMNSDAAIIDTFLHPQDTAYSVQEVLDFVDKNNLIFKGWLDSGIYNQEWEGLDPNIPERDRWSVIENLTARIAQHTFMVSRPERDSRSDVNFDNDNWLDYFPVPHPDLRPSVFQPNKGVRGDYEFMMSAFECELLAAADGSNTIGQILKRKALVKMATGRRHSLSKDFFKRMWRLGHMFFSRVPVVRLNAVAAAQAFRF